MQCNNRVIFFENGVKQDSFRKPKEAAAARFAYLLSATVIFSISWVGIYHMWVGSLPYLYDYILHQKVHIGIELLGVVSRSLSCEIVALT
jgi:hypothetical protein